MTHGLDDILAEGGGLKLPSDVLRRVDAVSKSVWEEIRSQRSAGVVAKVCVAEISSRNVYTGSPVDIKIFVEHKGSRTVYSAKYNNTRKEIVFSSDNGEKLLVMVKTTLVHELTHAFDPRYELKPAVGFASQAEKDATLSSSANDKEFDAVYAAMECIMLAKAKGRGDGRTYIADSLGRWLRSPSEELEDVLFTPYRKALGEWRRDPRLMRRLRLRLADLEQRLRRGFC